MSRDPLEGADVGETREFGGAYEVWASDLPKRRYFGDDRDTDVDVTDIEVFEKDDGETVVAIHYDGEVTKLLPRNWDECKEPRTVAERTRARRQLWARRAAKATPIVFVTGVWLAVMSVVYPTISRVSMELSGASTAPSFLDVVPGVVLIFIVAGLILWALSGGAPRVGGIHR